MMKSIIKKQLTNKQIAFLQKYASIFNLIVIKSLCRSKVLIRFSLFFDKNYVNEQYTFLRGAYLYQNRKNNKEGNEYYLRRNIHRLEKGLLMNPRRTEFGLGFIKNTVESFINFDHTFNHDIHEWGNDVLTEYFNITSSNHKGYLYAKDIFLDFSKDLVLKKNIPYVVKKGTNINFDDFYQMNAIRKSTRWFQKKEVEKEKILDALGVAKMSPSSCNRQPYRYVVTTDLDKASKIASFSGGTAGWAGNVPAIAVLIGRQRSFMGVLNRHTIYIDATLTIMPFLLSLETLGLSSCIINWVDDVDRIKNMKAEIELDEDECIIASIAIGYSLQDGLVACSKRMELKQLVEFI